MKRSKTIELARLGPPTLAMQQQLAKDMSDDHCVVTIEQMTREEFKLSFPEEYKRLTARAACARPRRSSDA